MGRDKKVLVTTNEDLGSRSHSVNEDFLIVRIPEADRRRCIGPRSFLVPTEDTLNQGKGFFGEFELAGQGSVKFVLHDLKKNQLMLSHDQAKKVSTEPSRSECGHKDVRIQADPHHDTSL